MPVREIPRSEWSSFLQQFSRMHERWLCTLEVRTPLAGDDVEARHVPFAGFDSERRHGHTTVQVFLGTRTDRHVGHEIEDPTGIWLETTYDGIDAAVRIESRTALLRLALRSPMAIESVNGLP